MSDGPTFHPDGQVTIIRSLPGLGVFLNITIQPHEIAAIQGRAVKTLADQREELATAIEMWCYTHHEIVNDRDVTEMCPRCKNAATIVRSHGAGA